MLDDFTMIVHRFPEDITVIPVGDVHLGAIEHNAKAWDNFCLRIKDEPDTYLMLLGDLIQNNTKSAIGSPFDQVYRPMEQKQIMTEYLTPLKDKILCAVSGNHERRTTKESDQDITYDIMCKLGIENLYRENVAFVKLALGTREATKAKCPNVSYCFCVTHGTGGGIYTSGTVLRNERFAGAIGGEFDCLIAGHTHKGTVTRPTRIVIDGKNEVVTLKSYLVVSAESWMAYGGYAMQKMLLPAESCVPQRLHLTRSRDFKRIEVTW